MSKVRILFLGTPDFAATCLQRMLNDEHFEIVGVVTQPDRPAGRKMRSQESPVKKLALERGLTVLTPDALNTPEFFETIRSLGAESAAVVAFGRILSQRFLDLFPSGCVNVHASVLPRWRGAAPIQRALMAGDSESGVSLQVMVKKLDAGDVLGERRLKTTDDMDAVALHDRLKELGADLLHVEYMDYLRGNLSGRPQDESQVTYAAKIEKSEAAVRWGEPARVVFNQIRGLTMGPVARSERDGKILKILRTRPCEGPSVGGPTAEPGTVVEVRADSFIVACGQGSLEVLEVQPESRARMKVSDYLCGYPLTRGERFR